MGDLEAIKYTRGSLELLDQRLLPLESTYIPIEKVEDGWVAIRDMVVRGAPAIGVAAALSLAVHLTKGGMGSQFESVEKAAEYVKDEMDFLVTSRPTAVNISDTAAKLGALCTRIKSEEGATPAALITAVVEACEGMMQEDVQANKALGRYGAKSMMDEITARGLGSCGKARVLTHCNTGSLATAGYGTALGVIRALNENGQLAEVYCTETRPYNQGARLTAYELVHDGLPATLICDSMAAALMSQGKVDAVVVGADRVARNGDTANKIGTLGLAVLAKHFRIPFFVAAPSTSIDLNIQDGSMVDIELRPGKEITHFRGEQVTPEGIAVWNPAFDITDAALIHGIITERGTISPGGDGFQIAEFLGRTEVGNGIAAPPSAQSPNFKALTADSAIEYVASKPELVKIAGTKEASSSWTCREVGDGNINFVYIVEGDAGSLVLKQGLPYVRCVGESWPLTQDRVRVEAESLMVEYKFCPQHVPEVYLFDAEMYLIAMQYLAPPHLILRNSIADGSIYPSVAEHVAEFLAQTLFWTSLLACSSSDFRQSMGQFSNPEMCKLTEQVIFMDPYYDAPLNRWTSPMLDDDVHELQADDEARLATAELRRKFLSQPEALIHGDLHTGSLMVTQNTTYAIDSEFAFYGPMGFDIGKIIGNFLLGYFAVDGYSTTEDPRTEQRQWLLDSAEKVWPVFKEKFLAIWQANPGKGELYPKNLAYDSLLEPLQEEFIYRIWKDALGFCGAVMIRRLVGIAHVPEMESITDDETRSSCERRALKLGRKLLTQAKNMGNASIQDVIQLAMETRNDGKQPYF